MLNTAAIWLARLMSSECRYSWPARHAASCRGRWSVQRRLVGRGWRGYVSSNGGWCGTASLRMPGCPRRAGRRPSRRSASSRPTVAPAGCLPRRRCCPPAGCAPSTSAALPAGPAVRGRGRARRAPVAAASPGPSGPPCRPHAASARRGRSRWPRGWPEPAHWSATRWRRRNPAQSVAAARRPAASRRTTPVRRRRCATTPTRRPRTTARCPSRRPARRGP